MKNLNKKYFIGLTVLVIAILICLSAYWLLFGLIIYGIGSVFIVISNANIKTKITTIVIPLVLYLIAFNVADYLKPRKTPTHYIIPKTFNGEVRIAYGLDCGVIPETKNGIKILSIPKNGILLLKTDYEKGVTYSDDEKYFFEGDNKEIKGIYFETEKDMFNQSYLSGIYGTLDGELFNSKTNISYTTFHIYNNDTIKKNIDTGDDENIKKDSIFRAEIKECLTKID